MQLSCWHSRCCLQAALYITLIQTEPSGAKVYMNEEYKGVTPLSHSDTKIVGSITSVRFEKEGYETLYTTLTRNESADVGAIIGGIFSCSRSYGP